MAYKPARGVRDYSGKDELKRKYILEVIESSFKTFGFNPLDTPVLERLETLTSKYGGGEEILKEIYTLKDQGGRDLALRYDLTVPLARYMSNNLNQKTPFKRYQIGKVFRDGPIKAGRLREFTQCDADIIGSKNMTSDAEMIWLAKNIFSELGANVSIQLNNRKLLDDLMTYCKVKKSDVKTCILSLDKLAKMGKNKVKEEMISKGIPAKTAYSVLEMTSTKGSNEEKLEFFKTRFEGEGTRELEELFGLLKKLGVPFRFEPSLARGLTYYTGTIYEIFDGEGKITSSLAAGGRYDEMITNYVSNKQEYPAIGISFGLDVISEVIDYKKKSYVKVLIIPIGAYEEALPLLRELRESNIPSDINAKGRNLSKGLGFADYYEIPYALLIGEDELKSKKYTLKDMASGKEEKLTLKELIKKLN